MTDANPSKSSNVRWVSFYNDSTETVPPYGVVELTSQTALPEGSPAKFAILKPGDGAGTRQYAINGPTEVPYQKYGMMCFPADGPVWVLASAGSLEGSEFEQTLSPSDGEWSLSAYGSGGQFTYCGGAGGESPDGAVLAQIRIGGGCPPQNTIHQITCLGKPTGGTWKITFGLYGAGATQAATWTSPTTNLTLSSANDGIVVGHKVAGTGIPGNTTVTAVAGTALTISNTTTASGDGTILSFTWANTSQVGTRTSGSTAVTLSAENGGIHTGMDVTGAGIASNTKVVEISGTNLTLSKAATTNITSSLSFTTSLSRATVTLPWDASSDSVEASLDGYSELGSDPIKVTGGPFPTGNLNIEYQNLFARRTVEVPTMNWSALTGGIGVAILCIVESEGRS